MSEEILEAPQSTQPTESKSADWTKIILAAVLGIGLLAASAYIGYWYGTQQARPTDEPSAISQPTATPAVEDETKDWKTYTNAKYGYSIKYPSDWFVDESAISSHDLVDFVPNSFLESKPEPYAYLRISLVEKNNTLDLRGWFEGYTKQLLNPLQLIQNAQDLELNNLYFIVTTQNIALHGDERLHFTQHGTEVYSTEFVLPSDSCYVGGNEDRSKFMDTFNLMLSTFKFLEVEDQTKDWQTYRSEGYGFEFRYPQNFQVTEGLGQYFLNQKPVIELKSDSFSYLQNTIDAYFTVSVKSNAKAECEYVPRGVIDTLQNKEINGVSFTMFSVGGAATGNTYSNTILHHLKGTTCYEVVTTIHEASDGNTSDDLSKINEQKTKLEDQLDQILSTFRFLD